jgi:hypothetical protein
MIYNNISKRKIDFTKARLNKQLYHYKHIVEVLSKQEVLELAEKWQGKTYNKRFLTALQKIDDMFHIDKVAGLYLYFAFYNDRCITMENYKNSGGYAEVTYIEGQYYHLCLSKNCLFDESTIKDDLVNDLIKAKEYYQNAFDDLFNQLQNLDSIIEEYNKIKELYNDFENKTNYTIRQELDLNLQTR